MRIDLNRKTAAECLVRVEGSGFSNLVFPRIADRNGLSGRDRAFAARIFYGSIERKITIDYILSRCMSRPLEKTDPQVLAVLETALYQIRYMDSVPTAAAVNRAVELCRTFKKSSAGSFVNAVLRKCAGFDLSFRNFSNKTEELRVKYSVTFSIAGAIIRDYPDCYEDILESSFSPSPLTLHINTLKINPDEYISLLSDAGIWAVKTVCEDCITVDSPKPIETLPGYNEGFFFVQGVTSRLAVKFAEIKKGYRVLDLCAAPGGKSFAAAIESGDSGVISSCDPNISRIKLIEKGAFRLGLKSIVIYENLGQNFRQDFCGQDVILCDVPCSGTGVMGRKPDIRLKNISDLSALTNLQHDILYTASRYLKCGGKIVYSTCTLNKDENERQIYRFLSENPGFCVSLPQNLPGDVLNNDNMITFLPDICEYDGFFIAVLKKLW